MRLFVAVEPTDDVRRGLERTLAACRAASAARDLGARWVAPINQHVTLEFLGEVDEAPAGALVAAFGVPIQQPPFEMALGRVHVFPTGRRPRMLALEMLRGRADLTALHEEVGSRLRAAGHVTDRRPFTPHWTLARLSDRSRMSARDLRPLLAGIQTEELCWIVTQATLVESDLSGRAPVYRALARAPLTGTT